MPTIRRLSKNVQTRSFARTPLVNKSKPLTARNQAAIPPRENVTKIPTPVNRRKGPRQERGQNGHAENHPEHQCFARKVWVAKEAG